MVLPIRYTYLVLASIVGVPAPVTKVIGPDTDPVCVQRNVYMMYV